MLGIVVAYAVGFALLAPEVNSRGIHWGSRFLLPAYPLLAVLASAVWVGWWRRGGGGRVARAALCAVLAISVVLQLYSVALLEARKQFTQTLSERVLEAAPDTVVVDTWFLTVDLGRAFYEKSIFLVRGDERGAFRALAERAGIERALSIERSRERDKARSDPASERLDDGWLHFSPVTLREIRLAAPLR